MERNDAGQYFVPMNVDGSNWNDGIMNSTKTLIFCVTVAINFFIIFQISKVRMSVQTEYLIYGIMVYIDQLIIRYGLLEERYYYRMYKKLKLFEISTPALFWNVSDLREVRKCAILVYPEGKQGVIFTVDKDTIVGRGEDAETRHREALSEFYREVVNKGFHLVQLNIMEPAGKDPRLKVMDDIVGRQKNENLRLLLEQIVGHNKRVARETLYETDYFLLYRNNLVRDELLIETAMQCVYKLLDGCYTDQKILSKKEVINLMREEYGVKYFNFSEATASMYASSGVRIPKAIEIKRIGYIDNTEDEVGDIENKRLKNLVFFVKSGKVAAGEWDIKSVLYGKFKREVAEEYESFGFSDIKGTGAKALENMDLDSEIFGVESESLESEQDIMNDLMYGESEDPVYEDVDLEEGVGAVKKKRRWFGRKKKKE